ncbi:hypothetical protein CRX72_08540 [Pantoea sp. BRM17]|nr:hypothetical protein CRX72_08540 [Pantoea sp. BRM17]
MEQQHGEALHRGLKNRHIQLIALGGAVLLPNLTLQKRSFLLYAISESYSCLSIIHGRNSARETTE